uniref:Uncharacterized protein n=1 Tax=Spironucleus salmonicida TaxID=348837 RepID=V6LKL3_9EUKA|eukprot:EST44898.1 Hypothetical protein SS50377_15191 [Spironucleus salmonicida]
MSNYLIDAKMSNFIFPVYIVQRLNMHQQQFEVNAAKNQKISSLIVKFIDALLQKNIKELILLTYKLSSIKQNYYSVNLFQQFKIPEHYLLTVQEAADIHENLRPFLLFYLSIGQNRGEFKIILQKICSYYKVDNISFGASVNGRIVVNFT